MIAVQRMPRLHLGRPAGALLGAARRAIDLDTLLLAGALLALR